LAGVGDEPAVLIHGDLWSGNTCSDTKGQVWIYDPAAYFAHREAEFGMIRLFGNFGPRFESAYQEVWPFTDGAEDRIHIYTLHHLLSHLWHFGSGYHGQTWAMLQRCLA
jgi:fructosamine-3-kinase